MLVMLWGYFHCNINNCNHHGGLQCSFVKLEYWCYCAFSLQHLFCHAELSGILIKTINLKIWLNAMLQGKYP